MNILTYLRVSTGDQTLEPQRIELDSYVSRLGDGPHVVEEFSDVISGAKAKRPGLDALIARCAEGGVYLVLVVKLDRLGRSVVNVVSLVQRLTDMGVPIVCTSQGIDTRKSNPCGALILSIMAAFAEFEKDIIRERTRAGLVAARARGKVLGRPSPTMVASDKREAIIKEWRANGGGYRELAAQLKCCLMTARKLNLALATTPEPLPVVLEEAW